MAEEKNKEETVSETVAEQTEETVEKAETAEKETDGKAKKSKAEKKLENEIAALICCTVFENFGGLMRFVCTQSRSQSRVDVEIAITRLRFGCRFVKAAPWRIHDFVADVDDLPIEVNVLPTQPEKFAASASGRNQERDCHSPFFRFGFERCQNSGIFFRCDSVRRGFRFPWRFCKRRHVCVDDLFANSLSEDDADKTVIPIDCRRRKFAPSSLVHAVLLEFFVHEIQVFRLYL